MSRPVVVLAPARDDLQRAIGWYNQRLPGLGELFRVQVRDTLLRIEEYPELYSRDFGNVRRALTRRFPYAIYYRILARETQVIAILDLRIDPSTIRNLVGEH